MSRRLTVIIIIIIIMPIGWFVVNKAYVGIGSKNNREIVRRDLVNIYRGIVAFKDDRGDRPRDIGEIEYMFDLNCAINEYVYDSAAGDFELIVYYKGGRGGAEGLGILGNGILSRKEIRIEKRHTYDE